MAEASTLARSTNGTPPRSPAPTDDARKQELERTLQAKVAQGFTIESQTDTEAVLVMKGRRRWFGLTNTPSVRYEVTVDEAGRAASRRL
jgi:hypothetical protein